MPSLAPTQYTYTPNGIQRQPGYYDPNNPYDTGRSGERNAELNAGGGKNTMAGWDYDAGAARPGAYKDANGNWQMPGGGGGSGSLLAGDAEYNQMLQDLKAQSISDKAARDAAIKKSFINFGLGNFDLAKAAQSVGIGDLASILDPQTLELAKNNQFSVQKRIERGLADRQRDNRVSLRQRGGVRSGESGFLAQRAQTDFDTDVYDSTQKLLDYISGAQGSFAAAEQERKRREFELALAAAQRYQGGGYGDYGYEEPQYNMGFAPDRAMPGLGGVQDWINSAMAGYKPKRPVAPTSRDIKTGRRRNAGGV